MPGQRLIDSVYYSIIPSNMSDEERFSTSGELKPIDTVQAAEFAGDLLAAIVTIEYEQSEGSMNGLAWTSLSRIIGAGLGIERDRAKEALKSLLISDDLFVVDHKKGTKIVSVRRSDTHQERESHETIADQIPSEYLSDKVFSAEQFGYAERILSRIASERSVEKGIKLKTLCADEPKEEKQIRQVVNKLAHKKVHIIEKYTPKLTRASNSRKNSEPFVRFTSLEIYKSYKEDQDKLLSWLAELEANT